MIKIKLVNLDEVESMYGNTEKYDRNNPEGTINQWESFSNWVELPIPTEELGTIVQGLCGSSSRNGYVVDATECCLDELDYYDEPVFEINQEAQLIEDYGITSSEKLLVVDALLYDGLELEDALNRVTNGCDEYEVFEDCDDYESLGRAIAESEGLDVDYDLEDYVNWERFAEDRYDEVHFYNYNAIIKVV